MVGKKHYISGWQGSRSMGYEICNVQQLIERASALSFLYAFAFNITTLLPFISYNV